MELIQISEGRCDRRRDATAPRPRKAKLTVSVSNMYFGITETDSEDHGPGVAPDVGSLRTTRPNRRGTHRATHPPARESRADLRGVPRPPAVQGSGRFSEAGPPDFHRSETALHERFSYD